MDFQSIDKGLFFLVNHGASNPVLDIIMPALTAWGYLLLAPYLIYVLWKAYLGQNRPGDGVTLQAVFWAILISFCSFLLSDWLAGEMKHLLGRVRPCNTYENVKLLVGCSKSYSMPSNHAANTFAAAVPLFYFFRRHISRIWGLYPFALAAIISFSRVYVGVHYPADVLAGALFGATVSLALLLLFRCAAQRYKTEPHTTLLIGGLFALSVFRIYYILHGPLDLSPDEAHYWEWSRRLDLSYYSKGPMVAYLIRAGVALFGDTVFGIRILAVACSTLSSVYLFKLVDLIGSGDSSGRDAGLSSRTQGLAAALLFQAIPLFTPFGVIFTIDSPFLFFWILSLYLFWKAVNSATSNKLQVASESIKGKDALRFTRHSSRKSWLVLGISVGLGLLTKYTMSMFYLCGFLFLLLTDKRRLLKTPGPYAAVLISLAVFSPVIIWNMQHDWVTIRHTAGQAHVAEGMHIAPRSFLEFLGSQIGVITPILFFMMAYALRKLQSAKPDLSSRFLLYFSAPVVGFFLLKSIQGKVQANWAMTGYITGVIAYARYFFARALSRAARCGLFAGIGLALLVTAVSHYPSLFRVPVKLDPSARLRGWNGLGTEVSRIYGSQPDMGNVVLFSDSYQVASELAFYVKGHPVTYAINLGRRMNQYDLWPDINSGAKALVQRGEGPHQNTINGIFVKIGDSDLPAEVARAFEGCRKEMLKVYDKDRPVREYSIFVCSRFQGMKTERPGTY